MLYSSSCKFKAGSAQSGNSPDRKNDLFIFPVLMFCGKLSSLNFEMHMKSANFFYN